MMMGSREDAHLFVISFCDHVARHIPYALVDDLRHSGHDALCLRTIEALALQALHKVVGVKVKVIPQRGGAETAVRVKKEWLTQMGENTKCHEWDKERNDNENE